MQAELTLEVPAFPRQHTSTIEFDGGTPCNIPAEGYGIGYGSYRINSDPIVRLNFNRPMSANAAEIFTLRAAVIAAKEKGADALVINGDSRIALKWANVAAGQRKPTKIEKTSPVFQEAVAELKSAMQGITSVVTQWQPRLKSVAVFGH